MPRLPPAARRLAVPVLAVPVLLGPLLLVLGACEPREAAPVAAGAARPAAAGRGTVLKALPVVPRGGAGPAAGSAAVEYAAVEYTVRDDAGADLQLVQATPGGAEALRPGERVAIARDGRGTRLARLGGAASPAARAAGGAEEAAGEAAAEAPAVDPAATGAR